MTSSTDVPTISLNNGTHIPQLGFGVFRVDPAETTRVVSDALEVGYRHIDTAAAYNNEEGVGAGLKESGISRDELFITTKLANPDQTNPKDAIASSLDKLGLDYVDLYLIHWPIPQNDNYVQTWQGLIEIAEAGQAKAIGVSNFFVDHLQRLIDETGVTPAVNQIELHVNFQQNELRGFDLNHGIATEAWYPLGGGTVSDAPQLKEIADAHGKSVAQVILRWHLQIGNVVIPKSSHKERMAENFDLFDFALSDEEMTSIAALDRGDAGRAGGHPLEVGSK